MKKKVLALDLEGTLISNAFSQFPRPGLYDFLEFCKANFERIVLFTAVSEGQARLVVRTLVESGYAPPWFHDSLEYVEWDGEHKDLNFIEGNSPEEILLVDDQEAYVRPDQMQHWVRIPEFEAPYSGDDEALKDLETMLGARLSG